MHVLTAVSQPRISPILSYPAWLHNSIHIHGGGRSHEGNDGDIFVDLWTLQTPAVLIWRKSAGGKRKWEPEKLNSRWFQCFITFPHFLLYFFTTRHHTPTCIKAHMHTYSLSIFLWFSLYSFMAWGANECGEHMRSIERKWEFTPALIPCVIYYICQCSNRSGPARLSGKALTALPLEVWQVHERRVRG